MIVYLPGFEKSCLLGSRLDTGALGFPALSGNKACAAGGLVCGLTVAGLLMVGCEKEGGGGEGCIGSL